MLLPLDGAEGLRFPRFLSFLLRSRTDHDQRRVATTGPFLLIRAAFLYSLRIAFPLCVFLITVLMCFPNYTLIIFRQAGMCVDSSCLHV